MPVKYRNMIMDIESRFTLEHRSLSAEERLVVECTRTHFAELSHKDVERDFKFTNELRAYASSLKDKYKNADEYLMFHVAIGSTPPLWCKHFDFPGNDAMTKFFAKSVQCYPRIY